MLTHVALDVLPSQALSVPCKWLFLDTKQITDDRWLQLGSKVFEELAIMESAWGLELYDFAAWHTAQVEEVLLDYEELLFDDVDTFKWEKELDFDNFELEL